jgi:hypothetical protein
MADSMLFLAIDIVLSHHTSRQYTAHSCKEYNRHFRWSPCYDAPSQTATDSANNTGLLQSSQRNPHYCYYSGSPAPSIVDIRSCQEFSLQYQRSGSLCLWWSWSTTSYSECNTV